MVGGLPGAVRDQCARWRLHIDGPLAHGSNAVVVPVTQRLGEFDAQWRRLGRPFDEVILAAGFDAGDRLARDAARGPESPPSELAVDGDLHCGQVLAGTREPWLTVDPVLLRGDICYDLGRVLWTRVDDMAPGAAIAAAFDVVVRQAELDRESARDWVVWRTVDYWLWALAVDLTEDPQRCRLVLGAFA